MTEKTDLFTKRENSIIDYVVEETSTMFKKERRKNRFTGLAIGFVSGVVVSAVFVAGMKSASKTED